MFSKKHKDHEISKLEHIYTKHVDSIKNEAKETQKKCDQLNSHLKLINEKIISVGNYKLEKNNELEELFDNLKTKLEYRIHAKLTKLMSCKNEISEKLKFIENIKVNIEKELYEAPKSELISKSDDLIKNLKNLNLNSESFDAKLAENINLNILDEIPSDILPPYECGIFEINDYKKLICNTPEAGNSPNNIATLNNPLHKDFEVIYSPELITNGLVWRLKVYPNGNGAAKGEYISIFLELIEGLYETSKYYYKIELCNFFLSQGDKRYNNYSREFSSDFTNGECWGYNRFYKIENLEKEGYIDNFGKLRIKFYVRSQTYSQLCRDQKNYILTLEKRLKFYMNNYAQFKEKNLLAHIEQNVRTSEEIAINNFNMINNINNVFSNNNEDRVVLSKIKIEEPVEVDVIEKEINVVMNKPTDISPDTHNKEEQIIENNLDVINLREDINQPISINKIDAPKDTEQNKIKEAIQLLESNEINVRELDTANNIVVKDLFNSEDLNRENQNCLNNLNIENPNEIFRKIKNESKIIPNIEPNRTTIDNLNDNNSFEKEVIKNFRNSCDNFESKFLQELDQKEPTPHKTISKNKISNSSRKKTNLLDNFIEEVSFENSPEGIGMIPNNIKFNQNFVKDNNYFYNLKKFEGVSSDGKKFLTFLGSSFDSLMDSIKLMEDVGNDKKGINLNLYDNLNVQKFKSNTEREDFLPNKKFNVFQNKLEKERDVKDVRKSSEKINEIISNLYPENSFKFSKNYYKKNSRDTNYKLKAVENYTTQNFTRDINNNVLNQKISLTNHIVGNSLNDLIGNYNPNELGSTSDEKFRNITKKKNSK